MRLSARVRWVLLAGLLISGGAIAWTVLGRSASDVPSAEEIAAAARKIDIDRLRPQVARFCGDCHATPPPESFPRNAWYDEVERGYHFYFESGRADLAPPRMLDVVAFYRQQAPEKLLLPSPPAQGSLHVKFAAAPIDVVRPETPPGTAFVKWLPLAGDESRGLLTCDMRTGAVRWTTLLEGEPNTRTLARLHNPCHAEACDLDGDGLLDVVIAELGSFQPADHDRGRVIWRRRTASGKWETHVLAQSLGRVADVRPADFDGDGDLDLVAAEFGWHKTGGIHLLENRGGEFHTRKIDSRPGTIHTPVCDLNGDGRPDFVALISQDYETIEAFVNDGDGRFTPATLWQAADPAYGLSGMEMVDLDQDGDLDVLFTSGDTFDSIYLKPAHGVHWLENRSNLEFAYRRIAVLPGAYRAAAGDFDGDGDLDILATTFLPKHIAASIDRAKMDSIVLLEHVSPGKFAYHALEQGRPEHASAEPGDFDGDGDLDFVVGIYVGAALKPTPRSQVWWNQGPAER